MRIKSIHRIVLLGGALLLAGVGSAQPRLRQPEIYFGVQAGAIASTVHFSPKVENMTPLTKTALLGANGGFVFRYSGQKCCAVQVELNYMQRGWREKNEEGYYTRALHYIEVPFLMHIYFGSPQWRGFFNLGPQIGYCVYDNKGQGPEQTVNTYQYNAIERPFDWGVAGGLGGYYRSRNAGTYQLEVRFNYSLGSLFADSAEDYFSASSSMNLSLNLAWLWEFKPRKKAQAK